MALSCFLGPVGWLLGPVLFPDPVVTTTPPPRQSAAAAVTRQARGRHIDIPPRGVTRFVRNEVLLEVERRHAGAISQRGRAPAAIDAAGNAELRAHRPHFAALAHRRQSNSVRATLRWCWRAYGWIVGGAGELSSTRSGQAQPPAQADRRRAIRRSQAASAGSAQDHQWRRRAGGGDRFQDRRAASRSRRRDRRPIRRARRAGAGAYARHRHGRRHRRARQADRRGAESEAARGARLFRRQRDGAQGTTFNILKGLDWAASKNARIVNMSFAGPPDPMLRDMLAKAHARGIVLIAAVGNAGPRSPPLYPAADPDVIGVTATDADDKLLPQANRGAASRGGGARRAGARAGARRRATSSPPAPRLPPPMSAALPRCCWRAIRSSRPTRCATDLVRSARAIPGKQARRRRRRDRRARRGRSGEIASCRGRG